MNKWTDIKVLENKNELPNIFTEYNNSGLIILLISKLIYISHVAVFRKVLIHSMFKIE